MNKKLYTEEQYRIYSEFMDGIANEDMMVENMKIYDELNKWLENNNITDDAIDQMDERMLEEDTRKIPVIKRIK